MMMIMVIKVKYSLTPKVKNQDTVTILYYKTFWLDIWALLTTPDF